MKHYVMIVWGEAAGREVEDVFRGTRKEFMDASPSEYEFNSRKELNAFLHGAHEAIGWLDHKVFTKARDRERIRRAL